MTRTHHTSVPDAPAAAGAGGSGGIGDRLPGDRLDPPYLQVGGCCGQDVGTGALHTLVSGVEAEGWRFVAFVRLVLLFPFNPMNYAFGLTRIRLIEYTLATLVCMTPGGWAYTYLGFAGRKAMAGGKNVLRQGMIALALLATVLFLPRLVKRVRCNTQTFARMDVAAFRQTLDED